jgi:predicted metal-binding protein
MKRKLCLIILMLVVLQVFAPNDELSYERTIKIMEAKNIRDLEHIRILTLIKAMKIVESRYNYFCKGGSGEYGALQFMPNTWKSYSIKYSKKVLKMTSKNQDYIAYKIVKELVSKGYNDLEIASIWNCGSPRWKGKIGVNKYGVKYNVPKHVNNVNKQLIKLKNGQNKTST